MSERIRELVIQIQHSARAIDRDIGLLYEEVKKLEAKHRPAAFDDGYEERWKDVEFIGEE